MDCFCGCGASVPLTRRGANKNGARADAVIGELGSAAALLEADDSGLAGIEHLRDSVRDLLQEGREQREDLAGYVHSGSPADGRAFVRWFKAADYCARSIGAR